MFSDGAVPTLEQHAEWMGAEMESGRSVFFVGFVDARPIGFVRFADARSSKDMTGALTDFPGLWFVSLAVDMECRGQGIGSAMFRLAERDFVESQTSRTTTLMTWARSDNPASWRVFESAGWTKVAINGFRDVVMRLVV
jgi:RimJ/RimL family protein N-acetyltransferase